MFKVGDKVRRVRGYSDIMPSDFVGIVVEVYDYGYDELSLKFDEFDSFYFGCNFELVED